MLLTAGLVSRGHGEDVARGAAMTAMMVPLLRRVLHVAFPDVMPLPVAVAWRARGVRR